MTDTSLGSWSRSRRISSVVLAVLAGLLFGSALLVVWLARTLFDATMPRAEVPLISTDRAAALAVPGAEVSDTLRAEAERASADAVAASGARRSIYLCHNHCELGAMPLVSELRTLRDSSGGIRARSSCSSSRTRLRAPM